MLNRPESLGSALLEQPKTPQEAVFGAIDPDNIWSTGFRQRPHTIGQSLSSDSHDPFQVDHSLWSSSSQSNTVSYPLPPATAPHASNRALNLNAFSSPSPSQQGFMGQSNPMTTLSSAVFGNRRASALDPLELQQLQAQAQNQPPQQFNTNYTTWPSNNQASIGQSSPVRYGSGEYPVHLQQQNQLQPRHSAPDTGFFVMNSTRHNSLDNTIGQAQVHLGNNQGFINQQSHGFNQQQAFNQGQTSFPLNGLNQSPSFNEGVFDMSNAMNITETTPALKECYRSVDSYFTDDPFKRVTITADSVDNLGSVFESMVKAGAQLPRFNSTQLPSTQLILVAFKAGRVDVFYLPDNCSLVLKPGDLVVVEADRGRDLGKVLKLDITIDEARLLKYLQHQEQQAALASFETNQHTGHGSNNNNGHTQNGSNQQHHGQHGNQQGSHNGNGNNNSNNGGNNIPTLHFPKPILRFAMPNEVYQIMNKKSDETKATNICALRIESSGLQMRVIDSEYQWDRRKLTYYYVALHRIDFRELVKELFRVYKTRIWMCAVTSDVSPEPPVSGHQAEISLQRQGSLHRRGSLGHDHGNHPQSPAEVPPLQGIWQTPQQNALGQERDLSLQVPRQFSSPDRQLWN